MHEPSAGSEKSPRPDVSLDSVPSDTPGPVLLTPRLIGDVNRSRILQTLCDHGPTTRADLARLAGVPRATIGAIAQGLVDDGLLEEYEPDRTTGKVGKPGRPVWFRRDAGLSASVVFDAHGVGAALVNARGELLTEHHEPLETADADAASLREAVSRAITAVLPKDSETRSKVLGIGLAVPGVCDTAKGAVVGSAQLPGSVGTHLVERLSAQFALPVLVDNDARVQALGEKWFGDGRGVRTFAAVQVGEGLGVGLVLGGLLHRGEDGRTGELGHTAVVLDGEPCSCGLRGCWETVASSRWLRGQAAQRGLDAQMDSARLVELADSDDGAAQLLEEYADHLAIGLANLMQVLAPQRLLLHGDVVGGGERLRSAIEQRVKARSLAYLRDEVVVMLSGLDQDAGLLGAAGLVLSETFKLAV